MIFINFYKNNKRLFSNFSYITILEIFILIAPFITYPYLVCILGRELYGWVITAQITASYCTILIDFGFKRISARHIANNCGKIEQLGEIVSSILILRFILWIISFIIYYVAISLITPYRHQFLLFIFSFFTTLSSVLFLDFYFQGIERMKYITITNIIVRSLFIGATFLLIKVPSDYIKVPVIWSIGYILGGGISIWVAFYKHKLLFKIPTKSILLSHFKEGSIIFISDVMMSIKDKLNYNIMGAIIGMSDIVIYDIGSKISNLLQKPTSIICTVLFPIMAKYKSVNRAKKAMFLLFVVSVVLVLFINIFLPHVVKYFIDEEIDMSAIRLYTFAPIILSLSCFISINVFFAFGYEKYVLNSTLITSIGYLVMLAAMFLMGYLNSVYSFVLLTILAYIVELGYRALICIKIFNSQSRNS